MTYSSNRDLRQVRGFAYEIKYGVSHALAGEIRAWARASMSADPNASGDGDDGYRITSLYFDTANFDVYHRRGSFARSKYRVRRYGVSDVVYLERKLKSRGLVSKWRTSVPIDELHLLGEVTPDRPWSGYWYHRRIQARRLSPVCQISYNRTARVAGTAAGPIRLTLDQEVQAHNTGKLAFHSSSESQPVSNGTVILELKYQADPPVLFKRLIEEFKLVPQPVSKYRMAAAALGYSLCPSS